MSLFALSPRIKQCNMCLLSITWKRREDGILFYSLIQSTVLIYYAGVALKGGTGSLCPPLGRKWSFAEGNWTFIYNFFSYKTPVFIHFAELSDPCREAGTSRRGNSVTTTDIRPDSRELTVLSNYDIEIFFHKTKLNTTMWPL